MRILAKVTGNAILIGRSSSELVLAIAASIIMLPTKQGVAAGLEGRLGYQKAKNCYGIILETIRDDCLGLSDVDILKGMHREMMLQLLLMAAWDAEKSNYKQNANIPSIHMWNACRRCSSWKPSQLV